MLNNTENKNIQTTDNITEKLSINTVIHDVDFIKELQKRSGSSLKQCMQCGTCSAVCDLSPDDKPFPRKEMIWASWGMKEKLFGNPDIWLCHQCGDCTAYCPRGVKPGDVLSAMREMSYKHYARPKLLGKLLSKPIFLPIAILIPTIIILAIIFFAGTLQIPDGDVVYSKFFPHAYLNSSFGIFTLLIFIGIVFSVKAFWKDLKINMPANKKNSLGKSIFMTGKELFTHKKFKTCSANKYRYLAHQFIFWGFISLLVVTSFAIIFVILSKYPLNFWNPVKILGNLASIFLILVLGIILFKRQFNKKTAGHSSFYDRIFLFSLLLLTLSGIGVEIGRFLNWIFAYHIYFVHLVLVWLVIIYLPFTKFAHIIYRTVALIYAKQIGRDKEGV